MSGVAVHPADEQASELQRLARWLVLLWRLARSQPGLESRLQRDRCEREAERAYAALEKGALLRVEPSAPQLRVVGKAPRPLRAWIDTDQGSFDVHLVAALRAVDRFLAALESGLAPRPRRVALAEGTEESFVVPRRAGWSSHLAARQAGHLEYWLRLHQVVPATHRGIGIEIHAAPRAILGDSANGHPEATKFAAGGLPDEVAPDWVVDPRYRCERLRDGEARWRTVEALLADAARQGVQIVVLPELTVDAGVRARVRQWLRDQPTDSTLRLVVAGSFHEAAAAAADGQERRHNVAHVFDGFGHPVLAQAKLRPMRSMAQGDAVDEELDGGSVVILLHCPVGLVGVAICLDFCEIGGAPVADLWKEIGPALMLVPSMGGSTTNNAHEKRSEDLWLQHATVTLVASQHPELEESARTRKEVIEPLAVGLAWSAEGTWMRQSPVLFGKISWDYF